MGDVAHRFALVALAKVYGFHEIIYSGPTVQNVSRQAAVIKVNFENVGSGLMSRDGRPLTSFEIAGPDLKFVPASAHIDGASVLVSSEQVGEPVAVRFGWSETSQPNLVNRELLPALPFRRMISFPSDH